MSVLQKIADQQNERNKEQSKVNLPAGALPEGSQPAAVKTPETTVSDVKSQIGPVLELLVQVVEMQAKQAEMITKLCNAFTVLTPLIGTGIGAAGVTGTAAASAFSGAAAPTLTDLVALATDAVKINVDLTKLSKELK